MTSLTFLSVLLLGIIVSVYAANVRRELVRCMLACDYDNGYVLSSTGCRCVRINSTETVTPASSPAPTTCPPTRCQPGKCQTFKVDANGCPTCECLCRPVPRDCSRTFCSSGSASIKKVGGCLKCVCDVTH